jgi:hypothetical protein
MKLLIMSRYSVKGASSRYRLFQYVPYLQAHGWDVEVSHLLDDGYIRRILSKSQGVDPKGFSA